MKASVVIPTKNPGGIFRQVLRAVLKQKTSFDFDVLVIDSGSIDGTIEFVEEQNDPRLTLHRIPPESYGHGKTRNLGIRMTRGEFAVMLTHDAQPVDDHWLEQMVATAESDDSIAGVFGKHIAYPHASWYTARELELHFSGFEATPVVSLSDRQRFDTDPGYRQFLHFFSDNNALLRRSVWEKYPYPDVDFAEDQIWAQTIIEAGYAKAYAPRAVVYHSHDYGLFERLQRSYDESYALKRLFGYRLCASPVHLLRNWLAMSLRDVREGVAHRVWQSDFPTFVRAPIDNLMRLSGHMLGTYSNKLPQWLMKKLSRDKKLFMSHLTPAGRYQ